MQTLHRPRAVLVAALVATAVWVSCSRPDVSASPTTSAATSSPTATAPASAPAAPQRSGPRTHALLIGVTTFVDPAMAKHNLRGPQNDVTLFKEVLERAPFNVADADVSVLAGLPADTSRRPTRANIEREFRRLRDVAASGDQIVVLMAGHGSQQPANDDPQDSEPDGFDEIFLPADASGWDPDRHRVRNAVVDDDVRRWVTEIRNTGAFVWLIVDACQSGTMSRGAPETLRQIPMEELVPKEAIADAEQTASRSRGKAADGAVGLADDAGDIAALFAANMAETTPEMPIPARTSPVHGLFTYTLAGILAQSSTPMTYRELGQRVLERYRAISRNAPTPMLEGAGLDREVLGLRTWPDRPRMIVSPATSPAGWSVDAGSIQGLTAGSILELFGPAGSADADKPIGMLRVTSVTATNARLEPVAYGGMTALAADRLVEGSRARVKAYSFGDLTLTIGVQQAGKDGVYRAVAKGQGPAAIERAIANLEEASNALARRVNDDGADWFVRAVDNSVWLVPAAGWQPTSGKFEKGRVASPEQFMVAPVDDGDLRTRLVDKIRRIARAENLMRMASESRSKSSPQVEISATRFTTETGGSGVPLRLSAGAVSLKVGEFLELHVKNVSQKPIDVTLLYVDSSLGIDPLFPHPDNVIDNQIRPGDDRNLGRFKVTNTTLGWESLVAIAVESKKVRQNFMMLAQESLATSRGASANPSPLQRLLDDAMFGGAAGTRSLEPQAVDSFSMTFTTWRVDAVK